MKLQIYSAAAITRKARNPFPPRTTLISIGDPELSPPELRCLPEHMLRLAFDDITEELARDWLELPELTGWELDAALAQHGTYLFSVEMARQTAAFIRAHINTTDYFLCQCELGQSRSAAVAAAIAEYYFGRGNAIFSDPRYGPNPLVYRRLLAALRGE